MFWSMKRNPFSDGRTDAGDGTSPEPMGEAPAEVESGKFAREVAGAASSMLVLGLIAKASEPTHGYEIARQISQSAPAGFAIKHGTLYPLLRSLEAEGLIQSATMPSTEGPPRRVLWVTEKGRATLGAWRASWRGVQAWVTGLLDGETSGTDRTPRDGATS